MLKNLELDQNLTLDSFPDDIQIFCISLLYWMKHSPFEMCLDHILSVIITQIYLYVIEHRAGLKTRGVHILEKENQVPTAGYSSYKQAADELKSENCVKAKIAGARFFVLNDEVLRDKRCYEPELVSHYEALKATFSWISTLGSLFGDPFKILTACNNFSGIFYYTVLTELRRKNDPVAYCCETLLANEPGLISCFDSMMSLISNEDREGLNANRNIFVGRSLSTKKNRNRKRRQSKVVEEYYEIEEAGDNEEVPGLESSEFNCDLENRFAFLSTPN
jgi:hypothetical protein